MKTTSKPIACALYALAITVLAATSADGQSAAVRYNLSDGSLTQPTTLNLTGAVTIAASDLPSGAILDTEIDTFAELDAIVADQTLLNTSTGYTRAAADSAFEVAGAAAAVQADLDQNESDADTAIAAVQSDVDQNESDADTSIAAVQSDVDQNESDADTAIGLKADASALTNVDNTSDANKPISTATQTALDALSDNAASKSDILDLRNTTTNRDNIVIWGDSLTATGAFGAEIAALYGDGRTVKSAGIGSASSYEAASRAASEFLAYPINGTDAPGTGPITLYTQRAFNNYNESASRIFNGSYVTSWETYGQTWGVVEHVTAMRGGVIMGNLEERLLLGSTAFATDANRIYITGKHQLQNADYVWMSLTAGQTMPATDASATGGAYKYKPYIVSALTDGLYASDFGTDVSGVTAHRANDTLTANVDSISDGNSVSADDCLQWDLGSDTTIKYLNLDNHTVTSGEIVTFEFEFYKPDANAVDITSLYVTIGGAGISSGTIIETNNPNASIYWGADDGWTKASVTFTAAASGDLRLWANGTDEDCTGTVVYLRNIDLWNPSSFEILWKTGESPTEFSDDGTGATPLTIHHGWSLEIPNHTSGDVYTIKTRTKEDDMINVLWLGRNNVSSNNVVSPNSSANALIASLDDIVSRLNQTTGRWLVMTPHNATELGGQTGEYVGMKQGRYQSMVDQAKAVVLRWPDNSFDSRAWLVSQGTSTEIARDTPAASLSSDGVHLTVAGYEALAAQIHAALRANGW